MSSLNNNHAGHLVNILKFSVAIFFKSSLQFWKVCVWARWRMFLLATDRLYPLKFLFPFKDGRKALWKGQQYTWESSFNMFSTSFQTLVLILFACTVARRVTVFYFIVLCAFNMSVYHFWWLTFFSFHSIVELNFLFYYINRFHVV